MSDEFDPIPPDDNPLKDNSFLQDDSPLEDDAYLDFDEKAPPEETLPLPPSELPAAPRILGESPVGGRPPVLPRVPVDPEQAGKEDEPERHSPVSSFDPETEFPPEPEGETPWHSGDVDTLQALAAPEPEEPPISQLEVPEAIAPPQPEEDSRVAQIKVPEIEAKPESETSAAQVEAPEWIAAPGVVPDIEEPAPSPVQDLDAQIAALQAEPEEPKPSRVDDLDAQIEALRRESESSDKPSPFGGTDLAWLNVDAPVEPPTITPPPEAEPEEPPQPTVPPSKVTMREQPVTRPIVPPASVQPPPSVPPTDAIIKPEEWEDDISPELAAVLFAGQSASAAQPGAPRQEAAAVEIPAAGPQVITAPSEPVHLTERAHALVKMLTAKELYSPAPDAALSGKVRSVRVEEPLPNDEGDRIEETRDYLRPNLPGLDGRLVKRVKIEEVRFADGSWRWTFERLYSDGGADRREVRANRDNTYVTRKDEIDKPDIATHKRVKRRDEEAMIYAPPPPEEKHGLLGGLFGKKEEAPAGPLSWRTAIPAEIKMARKTGGRAFS